MPRWPGGQSSTAPLRATGARSILTLVGALLACSMVLGLLLAGLFMPIAAGIGGAARGSIALFESMPDELAMPELADPTRILAANGEVIASPQDEFRINVTLDKVAPIMRQAQVAIEDHRFYEHGGLDLQGTMRAFVAVLRSGGESTQGGGSSLTQQYVKQALAANARAVGDDEAAKAASAKSYLRKVKELKYAMALEKKYTKDQILEKYFNIVYYGDGAYGVEAASMHYFSKHATDLTLSEAALLAGLVQNPSTTDPVHAPNRALARRNVVLDRMHTLELISDKDWAAAKARPIASDLKLSYPKSSCASSPYPYYCDYIMAWLQELPQLGETREDRIRMINTGGLVIQTTFDPRVQHIVDEEITKKVPVGDPSDVGAAAFVVEPGTGKVLAFGQNTQYSLTPGPGKQTLNWALETKYGGSMGFNFGSTAKAFALVTAFEAGIPINMQLDARAADDSSHPATYTSDDFPMPCGLSPGQKWSVFNDTAWAGGPLDLLKATEKSTNTFFVALVSQLGACAVRDTETRLGMTQANGKPVPDAPAAIILGATETSPQTVARAYATFAADGKRCQDLPVLSIKQKETVVYTGTPKCEQVISPEVAHAVSFVLKDNVENGSGKKARLASGQEAAGKTGTANGNNESWFVGYTPQLSVAVWVGTPINDPGNERRMFNVTVGGNYYSVMHGAAIAAPIWQGIVGRALEGVAPVPFAAPTDKMLNGVQVDVPSVRGLYFDDAKAKLEAAGFKVYQGRAVNSAYATGKVERYAPTGRAAVGSTITVYLSNGVRPAPPPTPTPAPPAPGAPPAPAAPVAAPPPVVAPPSVVVPAIVLKPNGRPRPPR